MNGIITIIMAQSKETKTEKSQESKEISNKSKLKKVNKAVAEESEPIAISMNDRHAIKEELKKLNFIPSEKTKRVALIGMLILCTLIGFVTGLLAGSMIQNNRMEERISRLEYAAGYSKSHKYDMRKSKSCIDESQNNQKRENRRAFLWR